MYNFARFINEFPVFYTNLRCLLCHHRRILQLNGKLRLLTKSSVMGRAQESRSQAQMTPKRQERLQRGLPKKEAINGVKDVIVVASGKGGVGKSTCAVNLAVALSTINKKKNIGLLDCDIYGPSIPIMMNLSGEPTLNKDDKMEPLRNYGVSCMSMGFLVDQRSPIIWRGLMVMSALQQLLRQVNWGLLDVLVVDMPPGTGDTQLSLSQTVPITGAIIVTTPQNVALSDVIKGVEMFNKVHVPVFGIIENMSYYVCSKCNHKEYIFGKDGVKPLAQQMNLDVLGKIPLHTTICETSDKGTPVVLCSPESAQAKSYKEIASKVALKLQWQTLS